MEATADAVEHLLDDSRSLGFLGPGDVAAHTAHAHGLAAAVEGALGGAPDSLDVLDLGAGGGVPGLVLALRWPAARFVFLDANERRTDFLSRAVDLLGFSGRVRVLRERAESAARDPQLRGSFDVVVARSFSAPATTAECGAPFLRVGGLLAVSEPPAPTPPPALPAAAGAVAGSLHHAGAAADGDESPVGTVGSRWSREGCEVLGLEPLQLSAYPVAVQLLVKSRPCPDRYPRRVGIPAKRPLF